MLTLNDARNLQPGDILIDERGKRWKVNGQVKTWKRNPNRIYIPLKHGLYAYDYLDEVNFVNGECNLVTRETDAESRS